MMAGRTNETKGAATLFTHGFVDSGKSGTCRQLRYLKRLRADTGIGVDEALAALRERFDFVDKVFAMAPRNVLIACRLRSNPSKLSRKSIILPECVQNGREPPRIFRMKTGVVFQICRIVN